MSKKFEKKIMCACGKGPYSAKGFEYHATWCKQAQAMPGVSVQAKAKPGKRAKAAAKQAATGKRPTVASVEAKLGKIAESCRVGFASLRMTQDAHADALTSLQARVSQLEELATASGRESMDMEHYEVQFEGEFLDA
jgi:hypothetical protein